MSNRDNISGIYAIVNLFNGKKYIGQAIDMVDRKSRWFTELKNKNKRYNRHLVSSFHKFGGKNFVFIFLEECNEEKLNERERYHIKVAGWPDDSLCYNIDEGGKSGGRKHPETRKKLSETRKRLFATGELESWNKDKKCPQISKANIGKKQTDETKKQISMTRKKLFASGELETWNKDRICPEISEGLMGHVVSDETRKKQSEKKKGENCYWYGKKRPDHSKKMTGKEPWNKGIKCPQISEAKTGKKCPYVSERMTGENNPSAKINTVIARTIKFLLFYTTLTHQEIADGIPGATKDIVSSISKGRSWKKVKLHNQRFYNV